VLVRKPGLLLIDEPELNLHASLQLRFLTLLAKYTSSGVIFSTHSLGLARSAADVTMVCQRDGHGLSRATTYETTENLSVLLGELGYAGYNDTTFKAVLLVEGVTEVRSMQELLKKFGVRNEVVVVPLGGSNLANGNRAHEMAELQRLSHHVYALVDSERAGAGQAPIKERAAFAADCDNLNIDCLLTERRAFENYLDLNIAREMMRQPDASDFGHFERPKDVGFQWSKDKNWRIVDRMGKLAFENTDLHPFIERIVKVVLAT
jgi:energy-coupling factor transporter ATP-binding protein EcfA2